MPAARSPKKVFSEVRDKDGDQNRRRRLQDALPVEPSTTSEAKTEARKASEISNRKPKELSGTTSAGVVVPRSRSLVQHDDRGTAAQDGRHSGRRLTSERGRWTDSRTEGRATDRTSGSNSNGREEKPEARGGDSRVWRHDRFAKVDKNADPPSKKRRQFREEKSPPESDRGGSGDLESRKDNHFNSTGTGNRWEEKDRHRPSERNDFGPAFVRSRPFPNGERAERTDTPLRNRFGGGEYDSRYRGLDKFGGRQGYQSSGGRVEKWKHDLYDETNKSPTKKDEDPVAKVEALLSL